MNALDKKIHIPAGTHLLLNGNVVVVGEKDEAVFTATQLIAVLANAQAASDSMYRVINGVRTLLSKNIVVNDPSACTAVPTEAAP